MGFLKEFTKRDFQVALVVAVLVFLASHFINKYTRKAMA